MCIFNIYLSNTPEPELSGVGSVIIGIEALVNTRGNTPIPKVIITIKMALDMDLYQVRLLKKRYLK